MSKFKLPTQFESKSTKFVEPSDGSLASKVSQGLPSFAELVQHEFLPKIVHPLQLVAFKNDPEVRWELIAMAVDNMVYQMTDRRFYTSYRINHVTGEGEATVLDHMGREYTVSGQDFWALCKYTYVSYLQIPLDWDEDWSEAFYEWKSQSDIWSILD